MFFGAAKLTKTADPDKYSNSGYGIGFDYCSLFPFPNFACGKNVVIFRFGISSSAHTDSKKKDILVLSKDPTQGLHGTTITVEAEYSINFLRSRRKCCLSLHHNGSNSFLFVNATKINQFEAENSEPNPLCLGNISKDFAANTMKKIRLNEYVYDFSIDYNIIDNRTLLILLNN